eukprot:g20007.t1
MMRQRLPTSEAIHFETFLCIAGIATASYSDLLSRCARTAPIFNLVSRLGTVVCLTRLLSCPHFCNALLYLY